MVVAQARTSQVNTLSVDDADESCKAAEDDREERMHDDSAVDDEELERKTWSISDEDDDEEIQSNAYSICREYEALGQHAVQERGVCAFHLAGDLYPRT